MTGVRVAARQLALIGLIASAGSGCAAVPPRDAEEPLPHFFQVDERLFRGAQPTSEGFRRLAGMGVRTVINLRAENPAHQQHERALAESHGMRWLYLPMHSYWQPSDAQVRAFLATVLDPSQGPVFVHCRQGEDRTGALVAVYRVVGQGWEPSRAYEEALTLGLGGWNPLLRRLVLRDARQKYAPVFAPGPGGTRESG